MLKVTARLALGLGFLMIGSITVRGQSLASSFGEMNIGANRVIVHATVAVPPGLDGNAIAQAAVRDQGARPFKPAEFSLTGLVWDQFIFNTFPEQVTVQYNPAGVPSGLGRDFLDGLTDWNLVGTSEFAYHPSGDTDRCPSLVKECAGPQAFDGFNDLGWASIGGCCTLAVTWYSTSIDEIDMAMNTRFRWSGGSGYDARTVLLHEAGHGLGLGHSPVQGAVMEATYAGPRNLHEDDVRGVTYLYPEADATVNLSGRVLASTGGAAIAGATVGIAVLPASTTSDQNGNYTLTGIPKIGTYEINVSAQGYENGLLSVDTAGSTSALDVHLTESSAQGGGGGDDPGGGGECIPRGNSGKCR